MIRRFTSGPKPASRVSDMTSSRDFCPSSPTRSPNRTPSKRARFDEHSAGASAAGAPEFIDLLTSENPEFQLKLGGGLFWLDAACTDRYGNVFMQCTPEQKKEILDLIAYRKNAKKDPSLSQGVAFFAFLRNLTTDGFYTSKIGIADLQYMGNTALREFPGCPSLPE